MGFCILPLALCASLIYLLYADWREKRRVELEKDLPRDHHLPRHDRSFLMIEKKLWDAMEPLGRTDRWFSATFRLPTPEVKFVRAYLRDLREDFDRGNRVYAAVVRQIPEMSMLARLEWRRLRINCSFQVRYRIVSIRLVTQRLSVHELYQLSDVVATFAYHVRRMLNILEESGNAEYVESILKSA
jgi:hypothetical protein